MMYQILKSGDQVLLDSSFNNSSIVEVISQTPNRMFTRIKDENSDWEVMTNRLEKINGN